MFRWNSGCTSSSLNSWAVSGSHSASTPAVQPSSLSPQALWPTPASYRPPHTTGNDVRCVPVLPEPATLTATVYITGGVMYSYPHCITGNNVRDGLSQPSPYSNGVTHDWPRPPPLTWHRRCVVPKSLLLVSLPFYFFILLKVKWHERVERRLRGSYMMSTVVDCVLSPCCEFTFSLLYKRTLSTGITLMPNFKMNWPRLSVVIECVADDDKAIYIYWYIYSRVLNIMETTRVYCYIIGTKTLKKTGQVDKWPFYILEKFVLQEWRKLLPVLSWDIGGYQVSAWVLWTLCVHTIFDLSQ
jgi:hypothetical protein